MWPKIPKCLKKRAVVLRLHRTGLPSCSSKAASETDREIGLSRTFGDLEPPPRGVPLVFQGFRGRLLPKPVPFHQKCGRAWIPDRYRTFSAVRTGRPGRLIVPGQEIGRATIDGDAAGGAEIGFREAPAGDSDGAQAGLRRGLGVVGIVTDDNHPFG